MFYINTYKRKFVNSVNMLSKKRLTFDYAVNDKYSFSLLDKEGQKLNINADDIFYIAADVNFNLTDTPCFYSTDYVIEDNIITFTINTYVDSFLEKVKSEDTELYIEIGIRNINDDSYKIILHDVVNAMPRVYVNGTPPTPIEQYYTKDEVDKKFATKEDLKDITVDLTDYYTKDEVDKKFDDITIDTTDFYTKSEIDTALTLKADVSELNNYQLKSEAFSGDYNDLINKPDISGKLDRSGKNQMIVDEGVFTINATMSFDVNAPFSSFAGGKVVCYDGLGVMNEITLNSNSSNTAGGLVVVGLNGKIPENLYEKTEVDLSNYYANKDIIISANKDADSIGGDNWHYATIEGGTGLILKSENTTLIKGNYINLDSYSGINIKAGDDLILDRVPMIRNASANTAGGLVVVGSDGKIPSNLYNASGLTSISVDSGLTGNGTSENPLKVDLSSYSIEGKDISISTNEGIGLIAPVVVLSSENNYLELNDLGLYYNTNALNTAGGLVQIGDDGKIPSDLYNAGSSYTGSNGITINNDAISLDSNNFKITNANVIIGQNSSSIKLRCNVANVGQTWIIPKVVQYTEVGSYYNAQYGYYNENSNVMSDYGNVHVFSLSAGTTCTLTVSGISEYNTLICIVDNANAGSLLFSSEEVISSSETGKYALVFSNLAGAYSDNPIRLYNKIEV